MTPGTRATLEAYAGLPDTHRSVLALTRSGMSYAAIAEQTGVPVARIRTWALHAVLALTQARLAASSVSASPQGGLPG
jgi:DNA-directed RNA polymerase specialized sigma24 family protein